MSKTTIRMLDEGRRDDGAVWALFMAWIIMLVELDIIVIVWLVAS